MSGHSKWSSIKHKKGAADAKRGKLFSKLSRAIIVAAREGGADPEGNATLATAIQKARDNSMPKDNIERAIARGAGTSSDGEAYEHITYEGYGPSGVALFVEALTDNRNRTASDVRHIFTKNDGSLGESGSVAWLFERKGVILVADSVDEDELTLAAADGGAEDVVREGSSFEVISAPDDLQGVRQALEAAGIDYESADLTMLPKTTVAIEDEGAAKKLLRLVDALEENDDVQDVYANFDIPERVLEAASV
jgi:YebC/PmpR family DNA-binding regulatory protein